MTEQEIRDLFKSKNVSLGRDDVWKVQQALVIKHAALERLGAEMGIRWAEPKFLRSERDEAVVLAIGYLTNSDGIDTAREWSVGEALIGVNYRVSGKQAAYVYAMAEKRAKDRVILKLAKLHGAYSEDEADDFKQPSQPSPVEVKRDDFGLPPLNARSGDFKQHEPEEDESKTTYVNTCREIIKGNKKTFADLVAWWQGERDNRLSFGLTQKEVDELKDLIAAKAPKEAA